MDFFVLALAISSRLSLRIDLANIAGPLSFMLCKKVPAAGGVAFIGSRLIDCPRLHADPSNLKAAGWRAATSIEEELRPTVRLPRQNPNLIEQRD